MKNKKLVISIIILAFLFYWFQVRPSRIRTTCSKKRGKVYQTLMEAYPSYNAKRLDSYAKVAENYYKACLTGHGIRK